MKQIIKTTITRVVALILTSLICFLSWRVFSLEEVFNAQVSYFQWLGISIISTLLFTQSPKIENDSKGPKIP